MATFTNPIVPGDPLGLNHLNANFQYLQEKTNSLQQPPFVVASENDMLALDATVGNSAIRTDITEESNQFILTALPASNLSNWKQLPMAVGAVMSVNGQTGNVSLDADDIIDPGTGRTVSAGVAEAGIALLQADRLYQGQDLTVKFATEIAASPFSGNVWAWIQSRIRGVNFNGIHVGDFIPFTVAGNTILGEVAGINTYRNYGDAVVPNHIDFISRDCWPTTIQWNLVNYNNGVAGVTSPWNTSNLFAFLNSLAMDVPNAAIANPEMTSVDYTTTGIFSQLPAALQAVIIQKRALLPTRFSSGLLLTDDNSWAWQNMGNLWVPSEIEVYGHNVWGSLVPANPGFTTGGFVQYPIFATSMKRIKNAGNGGARSTWWLCTPGGGSSTYVAVVSNTGHAASLAASSTGVPAPLCFRVA